MKLVCLAAVATVALTAMPAAAADLRVSREPAQVVRISVIGKTDRQVAAEIRTAASTVCSAQWSPCVETAITKATRQYAAIKRARDGVAGNKVEVARLDRTTIHVKVAGRSVEQINADINAAAKAVCRAAGNSDYRACVDQAARNAKGQLRDMQVASAAEFAAR